MIGLERTVASGEITQVDYDEQRRITVIHVLQPDGYRDEIRFSYPEAFPDIATDANPYVILRKAARPEVSVVRLA